MGKAKDDLRFTVIDNRTGKERFDVFVLCPQEHPSARIALWALINSTNNNALKGHALRLLQQCMNEKEFQLAMRAMKPPFAGPSEGGRPGEGRASARGQ